MSRLCPAPARRPGPGRPRRGAHHGRDSAPAYAREGRGTCVHRAAHGNRIPSADVTAGAPRGHPGAGSRPPGGSSTAQGLDAKDYARQTARMSRTAGGGGGGRAPASCRPSRRRSPARSLPRSPRWSTGSPGEPRASAGGARWHRDRVRHADPSACRARKPATCGERHAAACCCQTASYGQEQSVSSGSG